MRAAELAETALNMKNVSVDAEDFWTTFEVIENGELERPLHHSERVLEQVLEWSGLDCPSCAFLVIKRFPEAKTWTYGQKQFTKGDSLKFSDGSSKLLSGHKFQDKYVSLNAEKLLLYRDIKATKAEKAVQLSLLKCYFGLKKKLKPPTSWGFTVCTDKQQWHFCCEKREAQVSWVTDIIRMKHGSDLRTKKVNTLAAADEKSSRGRSLTEGNESSTQKQSYGKRLTDRTISLDDSGPRPTSYSALQQKTNAAAKGPKHIDMLKAPEFPPRRTSVDACQPQRFSSPSPSRHAQPAPLPMIPQGGTRNTNRRPTLGVEGALPSNLLNELNSVLSKSSRGARSND